MLNPFKNISFKIISIVLAFILWFAVEMEREFTYEIRLPLMVVGLRKEYDIADSIPALIPVTFSGKGKELIKLILKPSYVEINCERFRYGRRIYSFEEDDVKLMGVNAKVVKIGPPDELSFFIDRRAQKELFVGGRVVGLPADGYIIEDNPKFTPNKVIAIGPASIVNSFDSVYTKPETLKQLSATFSTVIELHTPSPKIKLIPSSVNLTVELSKIVEKKMDNIPIIITKGRKTSQKFLLKPKTVDIIMAGSQKKLDEIEPKDVGVFVDIPDSARSNDELKPYVILPAGIRLVRLEPDKIIIMKK